MKEVLHTLKLSAIFWYAISIAAIGYHVITGDSNDMPWALVAVTCLWSDVVYIIDERNA